MFVSGRLPEKSRNLILGLLMLVSFALYASCLTNGFVVDDHSQIEQNPYVHSFKYVGKLFGTSLLAQQGKQAPPNFYRPLTNLSFLLSYQLFDVSPVGFHLVNILIHCVVVWLVFLVGARLFSSEWLGLLAAVLFSLHPIHVEPVAWIDGIGDPMMSAFFLLSFSLFLRLGHANAKSGTLLRVALVFCFALALFTKETAMVFPVLVTVFEHFYRSDRQITGFMQKVSRYGWVWLTQFTYLAIRVASVGRLVPARLHADMSLPEAMFSAFALIGQYGKKLVWPSPLIAFYPFQKSASFFESGVLLGVGVVAVLVIAFFLLWRRAPLFSFAIFWMGLTIAPALNARWMTASVFAERYLYLPSVAFCWIVAAGLLWIWSGVGSRLRVVRWGLVTAMGIVGIFAARATVARTFDWKSDRSLVVSAMAALPDSPHFHVQYGLFMWDEGDHAEAQRQWQLALTLNPNSVEAMANLGLAKLEEKQYDEAAFWLQKAIALRPRFATPHVYLAIVCDAQGRPVEAETEFRRSLEIHPTNTVALDALGEFYLRAGRLTEAAEQLRASLEIFSHPRAWTTLGKVYDQQGDQEKAADAWRHVVEFERFDVEAHRSLGQIYLNRGQWSEAQSEFQLCLLMNPADPVALEGIKKIQGASALKSAPKAKN